MQQARVIISSDIGGTDPDDFQSMVHALLYSDVIDLEGLISSPFGPGRKEHIFEVIDAYAQDYENLRTHSPRYPTPEVLRALTQQGETEAAPYAGVRRTTDGSRWIVRSAERNDSRPLHILVWGGIEDLAQALHDAPHVASKLRVYFIGGPNKKWSPDAYRYIVDHHPDLWMIESNSTYRGFFLGGDQSDEWSNSGFVTRHIAGKGALGRYFATHLGGVIKMGDTPSLGWLLKGTPAEPSWPSWGGRYVRAWERPFSKFSRLTGSADRVEIFSIVEFVLPLGHNPPARPEGRMRVENQSLVGHADEQGNLRFVFCPRDAKTFRYTIESNAPGLDGQRGEIVSVLPAQSQALAPSERFLNWWTDDPSPDLAEGDHLGARSVNQWRRDFLSDFAARLRRAAAQAESATNRTTARSLR